MRNGERLAKIEICLGNLGRAMLPIQTVAQKANLTSFVCPISPWAMGRLPKTISIQKLPKQTSFKN